MCLTQLARCESHFQEKLRAEVRIRSPNSVLEPLLACQGREKSEKRHALDTGGHAAVTMNANCAGSGSRLHYLGNPGFMNKFA